MTILNHIISASPVTWIYQTIFKHSQTLTDLFAYFNQLLLKGASDRIRNLFFVLGVSAISYSFASFLYRQIKFWSFLPRHLSNTKNFNKEEFKNKYGDCFVLITGAADGIGYAYSREFAKMGFNLIISDIQQSKLLFKRDELLSAFPKIKVQAFVCDMSNEAKIKQFITEIQKFDIGIVVNNVGLAGGGPFFEIDPTLMSKMLCVDFRSMYEINKALIPKLRARKNRSAIINMTSSTGFFLSHKTGVYSSIKSLADVYSRAITSENSDKIDIITARPFGVSTGMLKMRKGQRFITPKQCATAVINDLGHETTTFSGLPHKIMGSFFASLNESQRFGVFDDAWKQGAQKK